MDQQHSRLNCNRRGHITHTRITCGALTSGDQEYCATETNKAPISERPHIKLESHSRSTSTTRDKHSKADKAERQRNMPQIGEQEI